MFQIRSTSVRRTVGPALAMLAMLCLGATQAEAARWVANQPPVISGAPSTTATVGTTYAFQPSAYDPEGRTITFRIKNKPTWATFSSSTGRLSGAPKTAGRTSTITISATDGSKTAALPGFTITVTAPVTNRAPTIGGTPATAAVAGQAYSFRPTASDADGDALVFTIGNKPAWAAFDTTTGTLSGTPTAAGSFGNVTISVSDGKASAALAPFSITVTAPITNRAPTISGTPPASVLADQAYSFRPTASDADGDTLVFSIGNKPSWATFSTSTGALAGTPTAAQAGTYANVVISVSDGKLTAVLAPFTITVTAPVTNRAPTIGGTPVTAAESDRPYSFRPTAADADGDTLAFSIANKPSWATFDVSTGTLYGTPAAADVGSYGNVTISVSDGKAAASLAPFAITVAPAPTRSVTLNWTAPTSNTDGSALTDLAGYRVSYGNASKSYQTTVSVPNAGATSVVLEGLAPGTWYFAIRSYTNAGVDSAYSSEINASL